MKNWIFRWVVDEDGDIGLEFCRCITMIKYKRDTIIYWFKRYPDAPKYILKG